MVLKMKTSCPKCGSKNISNVTAKPLWRGVNKHYPENDPPEDKVIKPITDFNHTHYCNSCGHYFGGTFMGGF